MKTSFVLDNDRATTLLIRGRKVILDRDFAQLYG